MRMVGRHVVMLASDRALRARGSDQTWMANHALTSIVVPDLGRGQAEHLAYLLGSAFHLLATGFGQFDGLPACRVNDGIDQFAFVVNLKRDSHGRHLWR